MKIVLNKEYGGFSLSDEACKYLGITPSKIYPNFNTPDIKRTDPKLVECVEKLGDKASGDHAHLVVVELPDNIGFDPNEYITDYDGFENVEEPHEIW